MGESISFLRNAFPAEWSIGEANWNLNLFIILHLQFMKLNLIYLQEIIVMKYSTAIILLFISCGFGFQTFGQDLATKKNPSASQVIETIIKNTGSSQIQNTVDVIKEGDPATPVTGIITTMFGTMEVLKKAVDMKCNLIIVHEPLYYNHLDQTTQFQNDPVFIEKKKFIIDNKLVVWRFHDYIHRIQPDGILSGMVEKLGWENYVVKGNLRRFVIPETTLMGLLQYLKSRFDSTAFYVVGNPELKLSGVALSPGAPGSMAQIISLEERNVDVLIAGEVPQWETYEYMRDAVNQGINKAIIFLGHTNSEEAGMRHCAGWLKNFITDIPVYFVESGPSYWSY